MKFKNISTEEDVRVGKLRLEVTWDVDDVDRFSQFFGRPMAEVVEQIADAPAGTDDVMISAKEIKERLEREMRVQSDMGEAEAVCAIRGALNIIEELTLGIDGP